jgi:hypothetical protein
MPSIQETPLGWQVRWYETGGSHPQKTFTSKADALVQLAVLEDAAVLQREPWKSMRGLTRKKARKPAPIRHLLTEEQVEEAIRLASAEGPYCELLVRLLSTYGTRPVSLAKMTTEGVYTKHGKVWLAYPIKGQTSIHTHPISDEIGAPLRELIKARRKGSRLFIAAKARNRAWKILITDSAPQGRAKEMTDWYRRRIGEKIARHRNQDGIYELKRFAITRMFAGLPPWSATLTVADAKLFTGHKTDSQLLRYCQTNEIRAVDLLGDVRDDVQNDAQDEQRKAINLKFSRGEVAERLNAPVSKTGLGETLARVRIPPSPLENKGPAALIDAAGPLFVNGRSTRTGTRGEDLWLSTALVLELREERIEEHTPAGRPYEERSQAQRAVVSMRPRPQERHPYEWRREDAQADQHVDRSRYAYRVCRLAIAGWLTMVGRIDAPPLRGFARLIALRFRLRLSAC